MLDQSKINNNEKEDIVKQDTVEEVIEDFTMIESEPEEEEVEVEEAPKPVKKVKVKKEPKKVVEGEKPNIFLTFAAAVLDAGIVGLLTFGAYYLVDIIMRHVFGYYVVKKAEMALTIYTVILVLYVSIMEATAQFTVGKRIFGVRVSRN